MVFRLQAKHISLTYPRCDCSLEDLMTYLRNKQTGSRTPIRVLVCSEEHEDGGLHRHAYVEYNHRININNPRFFDFGSFHANVQACQNVHAWINYIKEDGHFEEWNAQPASQETLTMRAANMAADDYFEWCLNNRIPYGYAQRAHSAVRSTVNEITYDSENNPFLELNLPLERELSNFRIINNLTNVIVGPSGCGKTFYCFRNLPMPILLISHIDDLRYLDATRHKSILFDDMSFTHLPLQAQIHICDRVLGRSIHRRYGTTLIPPSIVLAVTCNDIPFTLQAPIRRRTNILLIN